MIETMFGETTIPFSANAATISFDFASGLSAK